MRLPMHPTDADSERSVTRSRIRRKVLIMLSSLGEAYPRRLARACALDATRLSWILHGHLPQYRPELSLVALGLVRKRTGANGTVYEITTKGRKKARSLRARVRARGAKAEP